MYARQGIQIFWLVAQPEEPVSEADERLGLRSNDIVRLCPATDAYGAQYSQSVGIVSWLVASSKQQVSIRAHLDRASLGRQQYFERLQCRAEIKSSYPEAPA